MCYIAYTLRFDMDEKNLLVSTSFLVIVIGVSLCPYVDGSQILETRHCCPRK